MPASRNLRKNWRRTIRVIGCRWMMHMSSSSRPSARCIYFDALGQYIGPHYDAILREDTYSLAQFGTKFPCRMAAASAAPGPGADDVPRRVLLSRVMCSTRTVVTRCNRTLRILWKSFRLKLWTSLLLQSAPVTLEQVAALGTLESEQ